jgi:tRNA (adenine22-N1)-methyltransferase
MKPDIKLSARLSAAAQLTGAATKDNISNGIADIGTDHALLPIKLVLDGHSRALASDINEGPCARARENIEKYRLTDKIKVVCRPGLERIEEFAPDTIIICGMGGEMITDILTESEYPAKSRCRLVLQPMTMQDHLRKYLAGSGFKIIEELVVYDEGKYYQLLSAEYDGQIRKYAEYEYRLGKLNLERAKKQLSETDKGWLEFQLRNALRRIDGRRNGAFSDSHPEQLADIEMAAVINNIINY